MAVTNEGLETTTETARHLSIVTSSRLLDHQAFEELHWLTGEHSSHPDVVIAADYEPHDRVYQNRVIELQDCVLDDQAALSERLRSAGVLLCYFQDSSLLIQAESLMDARVAEVTADRYARDVEDGRQSTAWLDLMVGRAYVGTLDEPVVDNYLHVILANGHDSDLVHAEGVVSDACKQLIHLHKRYFTEKTAGKKRARLCAAVDETVSLLIDRLAFVFGQDRELELQIIERRIEQSLGKLGTAAALNDEDGPIQGSFDFSVLEPSSS